MLKIRLQRRGRKKRPFYFVVVTPHTQGPKGKFIEKLGFYNPISQPKEFKINIERFCYWMSVGAQPSETIIKLVCRFVDDKKLIQEYSFDKFVEELKKKPKRKPKKEVKVEKQSEGAAVEVEGTAEKPEEENQNQEVIENSEDQVGEGEKEEEVAGGGNY